LYLSTHDIGQKEHIEDQLDGCVDIDRESYCLFRTRGRVHTFIKEIMHVVAVFYEKERIGYERDAQDKDHDAEEDKDLLSQVVKGSRSFFNKDQERDEKSHVEEQLEKLHEFFEAEEG
jgi:hypothetical protein